MHDGDEFDELEKLKELDSKTRKWWRVMCLTEPVVNRSWHEQRGNEIKESVTNKET